MSIKNLDTENLKFDQQLKINTLECIDLSVNNLTVDNLSVNDLSVNNINANDISTNNISFTPSIYTDLVLSKYYQTTLTGNWSLDDQSSASRTITMVKLGLQVVAFIQGFEILASPTSATNIIIFSETIPTDFIPIANDTKLGIIRVEENSTFPNVYLEFDTNSNGKLNLLKFNNSNWNVPITLELNSFVCWQTET